MSEYTVTPYQVAAKQSPEPKIPRVPGASDLKANQELRRKTDEAIKKFKKNLMQVKNKKGEDKYNELLAISLFVFAMAPEKKQSSKIEFSKDTEEKLKADGLGMVADYIKKNGGLDLGRYREEHKIICFIFEMADLKTEQLAEYYSNLGVTHAKKGNFLQAIIAYKKAIEINPDFAEAYSNLGISYAKKGYFDQAIVACKKAIEINPKSAEAYCNLGFVYAEKGNFPQAIREYEKALQINPDLANAHYNLGDVYARKKEWGKAIKAYTKVIEVNPNDGNAHYNLGCAYLKLCNNYIEKAENETNKIQASEMYKKANEMYIEAIKELKIADNFGIPMSSDLKALVKQAEEKPAKIDK